MSHANIETIPAYSLPERITRQIKHRHLTETWFVPCPQCGRIHQHGTGEGPRVSHCPQDNDYHRHEFEGRERPKQYILKYAGPATKEIVAAIFGRRKPSRAKTPGQSGGFRAARGFRKATAGRP